MIFTTMTLAWLEKILEERYGYRFCLDFDKNRNALILSLPGHEKKIVFDTLLEVFHQSDSGFSCGEWTPEVEDYLPVLGKEIPLPGIANLPYGLVEPSGEGVRIHYDILGLVYWMLSRYEEVDCKDLDRFHRFPSTASHAFRNGYLERPVVDEWLGILGQIMTRLWVGLSLKEHHFSIRLSHDVDAPSRYGFRSTSGLVRAMAGDVIRRKSLGDALRAPFIRMGSSIELHPADPYNTFDWIMDQSEWHGYTSMFYFICGRTEAAKDADYEPEHPAIRKLMRRIHERGHEIGLHPSFNTYSDPSALKKEADRLRLILDQEGIQQESIGSRMHYLRWNTPSTPLALAQAGISHDSSLGYADHAGFRCGTSHDYPMFDPVKKCAIPLRIRPLVAMECTVIGDAYMGFGAGQKAYEKFMSLSASCRAVEGRFSLLWHNSHLADTVEKNLYQDVLESISCG